MSKHIFETNLNGVPHNVQIGWDKPMRSFYYVISGYFELNQEWHVGDAVFSNLDHDGRIGIETVISRLEELSITIPNGLIEAVKVDKQNNVVNQVKYY